MFLSAFTTKTAVLALIMLFPGEQVLIWIGLYMIMYGIIYALLENDARRILAYSIVNQVGFMVCAVGIGTELALNGAAAHAFSHIIYKALLFMSAGMFAFPVVSSESAWLLAIPALLTGIGHGLSFHTMTALTLAKRVLCASAEPAHNRTVFL